MKKGELYDEQLLAKHLKEKGLLDDETLARAKRVRARLYEFQLPRPLDRILSDLGCVGEEDLKSAVKASKISDAPTEHIPAAVMAGHAAKARTEVREKLDRMRQALDEPKRAGEHAGAARAAPKVWIVAVCGAVAAIALAVLVARLLPPDLPEPDPEGKPRSFEPYAVEDDLDGLLGRVGFMPAEPGLIFVERPDERRVRLKLRRVREDARGYASSMDDTTKALAALRAGMKIARSREEEAELLLAAAETAEGEFALKLLRKLRERYGEQTGLAERSYIVEAGKVSDSEDACRAYRAYLARYPEGRLADEARKGLVGAGSSPEMLPQPEKAPVARKGSAIVEAESFEADVPSMHGRIHVGLDPSPRNRRVLAAVPEFENGVLRAFVVLDDQTQATPGLHLGFRAWGERLLEVSVLALRGKEYRWLGFSCELAPKWQTVTFSLAGIEGFRVHSVSFVASAGAEHVYIDDLTLFQPPR